MTTRNYGKVDHRFADRHNSWRRAGVYFLFVGVPRSSERPGELVKPPDQAACRPGTAQVVIRQDLLNAALGAMFRDAAADVSARATAAMDLRESASRSLPQGSGVQTGVQFENNRLNVPLAFTGSYNSGRLFAVFGLGAIESAIAVSTKTHSRFMAS